MAKIMVKVERAGTPPKEAHVEDSATVGDALHAVHESVHAGDTLLVNGHEAAVSDRAVANSTVTLSPAHPKPSTPLHR